MILAVTYNNGKVASRFGNCPAFKFYQVEDGKLIKEEVREIDTADHDERAAFLKEADTDKLICTNICLDCQEPVRKAGIEVLGCVTGSADSVVKEYLDGTLKYETDPEIIK